MMQRSASSQQGVVLIAALVMLVAMTGIGMSSVTTTNVNMMLANFQRAQMEVESVGQNVLNYLLSDDDYYVNYDDYLDGDGNFTTTIPSDIQENKTTEVAFVRCVRETPGLGGTMNIGIQVAVTPRYYWEVGVTVSETTTASESTYVDGFRMTYLEGYCP